MAVYHSSFFCLRVTPFYLVEAAADVLVVVAFLDYFACWGLL